MIVNDASAGGPYDVVVIGAGAAGITIARELGNAGLKVALTEAGGLSYSEESQSVYEGSVEGHTYDLRETRLRYLGGTTNHWSGWCRPMDEQNFEPNADVVLPPWPIKRSTLDTYLSPALDILDIDPDVEWQPQSRSGHAFDTRLNDYDLEEVLWHWSEPTRFKDKYYDELATHGNIRVLLHYSLIDLESEPDGTITGAVFRDTVRGEDASVPAEVYVLATGGIENARLLLYFNQKNGTQYGDVSGLLGKRFMEHPHIRVGDFVVIDPTYPHISDARGEMRFFKPSWRYQKQEGILSAAIRMYPHREEDAQQRIRDLARLTRLPDSDTWRAGIIYTVSEQFPTPENKVTLSDTARDSLDIPRSELHWHMTPLDYKTVRRTVRRFADFLMEIDMGRCRFDEWIFDEEREITPGYGKHHMGTTAMADNERDGVVNPDSLLFGTKNFYVAGSSVFPTGGYANPTLTIVQLSLRLADHIKERFGAT